MPYTVEIVALLPWDGHHGIPSTFEESPAYGWQMPDQARMVRIPSRIRLDEAGGFHVLGGRRMVAHLHPSGVLRGRTQFPQPFDLIIDFACDAADTCLVIARTGGLANRLHASRADGIEIWSTALPVGEPDEARRVSPTKIMDGGGQHWYLADACAIADVDGLDGRVRRILEQRGGAGLPYLAGGWLLSGYFDDRTEQRGVAALDPTTGERRELAASLDLFPWLVHPFGADARGRLYVWRDEQVARVGPDGQVDVLGAVNGVAVRGSEVFTSHHRSGTLQVAGGGVEVEIPSSAGFRLVHVDESGRYHLLGGQRPGEAAEMRIHSADGRLESSGAPRHDLAEIECRIAPHDGWQVDGDGRVVIPVATPENLTLVRLHPQP